MLRGKRTGLEQMQGINSHFLTCRENDTEWLLPWEGKESVLFQKVLIKVDRALERSHRGAMQPPRETGEQLDFITYPWGGIVCIHVRVREKKRTYGKARPR